MKRSLSLLGACLQASFAGGTGGALAAVVVELTDHIQEKFWGSAVLLGLPSDTPLALACLIGGLAGLVLALLQRQQPGSGLPELHETIAELRSAQGLQQQHCARQLIGGVVALAAGGTLGPEALMTRLVAVASRGLWRGRDRTLTAAAMAGSLGLFHSPLVGAAALAGPRWQLLWRWLPGSVGGVVGFLIFNGLSTLGGGLRGVPYNWPQTIQQGWINLLTALIAGVLGSYCGGMLLRWRAWLQRLALPSRIWWLPVVTGVLLGGCVWALPLVPFSGEQQLQPLVMGDWALPAWLLLVSGLIKLAMVGWCLETGWRGGQFFPVILASCALGMGLHQALPELGSLESWCAGMVGGSLSSLLGAPLLGLVLGLTLLQGHGAGALLVGLLIGQLSWPWRR